MKLHQFRAAVAIAEYGSLRTAARQLGIAQPTLTRGLADLERELDAPLFERRSTGMVATRLGEAFVRRATAILNDVRRVRDEIEQLRGNASGQLTIGLSIAAHLWLLPKVLDPFRRKFSKYTSTSSRVSIQPSSRVFWMEASIFMSARTRGINLSVNCARRRCFQADVPCCAAPNIPWPTQRRLKTWSALNGSRLP